MQMSYILEYATKTISHMRKLDKQTKSCFQTELRLENNFFVQKLQETFFQTMTMSHDSRLKLKGSSYSFKSLRLKLKAPTRRSNSRLFPYAPAQTSSWTLKFQDPIPGSSSNLKYLQSVQNRKVCSTV